MPLAPQRPCTHPGCGVLTNGGRCDQHRVRVDGRGSRRKKYDKASWRYGTRPQKLSVDPLCESCLERGHAVTASEVDHRDGNSDNDAWENLRSLCKPCHSTKTARENGGFGRAPASAIKSSR